jgi:hypothetical protein
MCLLQSQARFGTNCILPPHCHLYHCLSLDYDRELISELMVNHLYDSMVSTRNGSTDAEIAQPDGHSSPPLTLPQVIASIRELRLEQIELLHHQVTSSNCEGTAVSNARETRSSYVEFLATQPPTFTEAGEPLEADHWLLSHPVLRPKLNAFLYV